MFRPTRLTAIALLALVLAWECADGLQSQLAWLKNDRGWSRAASSSSSFLDRLDTLTFAYETNAIAAYETNATTTTTETTRRGTRGRLAPLALCYPHQIRPRGCEYLLQDAPTSRSLFSKESLAKLPCVTDGSCPFVRFKCSRGHEWNAVPGSPVCLHCPYCEPEGKSRRVKGLETSSSQRKASLDTSAALMSKVQQHAVAKGGIVLTNPATDLKYKSSVTFQCNQGHSWNSSVTNVLHKSSWCRRCAMGKKQDMHSTAAKFKGRFLGYVEWSGGSEVTDEMSVYGDGDVSLPVALPLSSLRAASTSLASAASGGGTRSGGDNSDELLAQQLTSSFYRYSPPAKGRSNLPSQSIAKWECERGHVFYQSANNVRRRAGGRRKCSWCPQCSRDGLTFEWTSD